MQNVFDKLKTNSNDIKRIKKLNKPQIKIEKTFLLNKYSFDDDIDENYIKIVYVKTIITSKQ